MGDGAAYDPYQMLDLLDHELPTMEYIVETMPALPE